MQFTFWLKKYFTGGGECWTESASKMIESARRVVEVKVSVEKLLPAKFAKVKLRSKPNKGFSRLPRYFLFARSRDLGGEDFFNSHRRFHLLNYRACDIVSAIVMFRQLRR